MRNVLRKALPLFAVCALVLGPSGKANAATIGIDIYSSHSSNTGAGGIYSGFVGTLVTSDIQFFNWTPFGLTDFAAHAFGVLHAASNGVYQFGLNANDGAQLFIDGDLVLDGGGVGSHSLTTLPDGVTMSNNAPYFTPFDVFYFSDGVGVSNLALDLNLGSNGQTNEFCGDYCVEYGDAPIPEPATLLLLGPAAFGMVARRWRKRA